MRHRKSFNHLGRTAPHRKAMLANMASSLIVHKRITTTTAKAKALRSYIEPLITKSKDDTTHSRRVVFSYLQDKDAVSELFRDVAVKVAERPGGYTRIFKIGSRLGDSAEMAIIELVDYNELLLGESTQKTVTRRKRRGGGTKAKAEGTAAVADVTDVEVIEEVKDVPGEPEAKSEDIVNEAEEVKSASEEVKTASDEPVDEVKVADDDSATDTEEAKG